MEKDLNSDKYAKDGKRFAERFYISASNRIDGCYLQPD